MLTLHADGLRPVLRRCVVALALLGFTIAAPSRAQQFRAAWADVFHVGMGSQNEVDTMVSSLVTGHYNALIVQVLGYMDRNGTASHGAHWKSSILPWSTRVTSSFDPLAYLCQRAHANGIEVHAWLGGSGGGPYRASSVWPPPGNTTLANHPEWFMVPRANSEGNASVTLDGSYLLDMGSPDAQEYIISIIRELVTDYPVDGINWDDEINGGGYTAGYAFPAYSQANYPRSGLVRYRVNTGYVGTPSATDSAYGDYRRRFKNELMARSQAEIQSIKTNPRQPVRHTSAPLAYGLSPPSTCDFTSSTPYQYYCDWAGMLKNGWIDAAFPQMYRTESSQSSSFRSWCDRSYSCWQYSRQIFMGLGAYLNPKSNTVTQLQYAFTGQSGGNGFKGTATYSYSVPSNDGGNWWTYAAANIYTSAATVPTMPWRNSATATEGIMWGRVSDNTTGLYVDDATVTVTGGPTVQSDGNGYYIATLISATAGGTVHSTTASKAGATSQTISNATVLAGDIVRYDFTLNAPPAAPSGVTATAISSSQINLGWTDNASTETGFIVARGTVSGGPYADIATLAANSTNYNDTGLAGSTTYYYVVRATNSLGSSLNSGETFATTARGAPITLAVAGDNSFGQISVPPGLSNVVAIAAGAWHSLALRANGLVVSWGNDFNGQSDVPSDLTDAVAIAAGAFHSLAIRANGTVAAWGADDYGQSSVPVGLAGVIGIAAGTWHSLALLADGTVAAWGDDSVGQTDVPPGLADVVAVAAGGNHNLALKADGTVVAWGDNTDADGDFVGQSVVPDGLTNVVSIAAGEYHSLAVRSDGTVVAWGDDSQYQSAVPDGLAGVVAVAGGGLHSLALNSDGTVAAWGANLSGQGDLPAGLTNASAIAAGGYHTLVLVDDGTFVPRLFSPAWNGSHFSALLQTLNRKNYAFEFKNTLPGTNWITLSNAPGNGALRVLRDPGATGAQRFYRVRQW